MKKVICIILVLATVFGLSVIAANAEATTEEKLISYVEEKYHSEAPYVYKELYSQKTTDGETA